MKCSINISTLMRRKSITRKRFKMALVNEQRFQLIISSTFGFVHVCIFGRLKKWINVGIGALGAFIDGRN